MYLVAKSSPINSAQGNFIFSRTEQVERLRLGPLFLSKPERLPPDAVGKIFQDSFRGQAGDTLLAIHPEHLPQAMVELLSLGELKKDLDRFCKAIVFCSYLTTANGEWPSGFVIEKHKEAGQAPAPFSFSEEEIQALTGKYLDDPSQTIFANSCHENGRPLNSLEFFPAFAFHLGYLKARSDLADKGLDPDSASYTLKASLAASYSLSSVQILFINLQETAGEPYRHNEEQFKNVIMAHQTQLAFYQSLLLPEDKAVLRSMLHQDPRN